LIAIGTEEYRLLEELARHYERSPDQQAAWLPRKAIQQVPAKPKRGKDISLSRTQVASLGGLSAAHRLGPEGRKRRAAKGGEAVLEAHGRGHFKKMALQRWGRIEGGGPSREKPAQEGSNAGRGGPREHR